MLCLSVSIFFFFNDTATTEIYTLSLHDALPICVAGVTAALAVGVMSGTSLDGVSTALVRLTEQPLDAQLVAFRQDAYTAPEREQIIEAIARGSSKDRKSTRLNSSHSQISYAVFC